MEKREEVESEELFESFFYYSKSEKIQKVILHENQLSPLGSDVLQLILSFLQPIPFLFQLKRVSSNWNKLCESCMKESCTELYWDEKTASSLGNLKKHAKKLWQFPEFYEDENLLTNSKSESESTFEFVKNSIMLPFKSGNSIEYMMFGLFRSVLFKFGKLSSLILHNVKVNAGLLYLLFVEWGKELERIKFINCIVDFGLPKQITCQDDVNSHNSYWLVSDLNQIQSLKFEIPSQLADLTIQKSLLIENLKKAKMKDISFSNCSIDRSLILNHTHASHFSLELMCFFSSIGSLETAYYDCFEFNETFDQDRTFFKKLVPNVKFNIPFFLAVKQLLDISPFEKVVEYFKFDMERNYSLVKNRRNALERQRNQIRFIIFSYTNRYILSDNCKINSFLHLTDVKI